MKRILIPLYILLVISGCGGGKGASNSAPSETNGEKGGPSQTLNGEISGKIYYSEHGWCYELDVATGVRRQVYFYDLGTWPLPSPDGKEFAGGANTTTNGNYYSNEDIIFFNLDGQDIGRRMINGDVRDVVKISPDGRFIAFNWTNDPEDGLVVLERNGAWERDFVRANGRGFDWTSSGGLVFARGNEIYKVENIATSEPEKITTLPTDTWRYPFTLHVSPDEKKIAFWFASNGDYDGHIYMIGMDGSDLHQVTNSNLWEHSVAWSPDSQYLAVVKASYLTNVVDSYWPDGGQGNISPVMYVLKADARNVDLSSDDHPKDAIVIKEIQVNGTIGLVTTESEIAWR